MEPEELAYMLLESIAWRCDYYCDSFYSQCDHHCDAVKGLLKAIDVIVKTDKENKYVQIGSAGVAPEGAGVQEEESVRM